MIFPVTGRPRRPVTGKRLLFFLFARTGIVNVLRMQRLAPDNTGRGRYSGLRRRSTSVNSLNNDDR